MKTLLSPLSDSMITLSPIMWLLIVSIHDCLVFLIFLFAFCLKYFVYYHFTYFFFIIWFSFYFIILCILWKKWVYISFIIYSLFSFCFDSTFDCLLFPWCFFIVNHNWFDFSFCFCLISTILFRVCVSHLTCVTVIIIVMWSHHVPCI